METNTCASLPNTLRQSLAAVEAALHEDHEQREYLKQTIREVEEMKAYWASRTAERTGADPRAVRIRELEGLNKDLMNQLRSVCRQLDSQNLRISNTHTESPNLRSSPHMTTATLRSPTFPSVSNISPTFSDMYSSHTDTGNTRWPTENRIFDAAQVFRDSLDKVHRAELQEAENTLTTQSARIAELQRELEKQEESHRLEVDELKDEVLQSQQTLQQCRGEYEALAAYKDSLACVVKLQKSVVAYAVHSLHKHGISADMVLKMQKQFDEEMRWFPEEAVQALKEAHGQGFLKSPPKQRHIQKPAAPAPVVGPSIEKVDPPVELAENNGDDYTEV